MAVVESVWVILKFGSCLGFNPSYDYKKRVFHRYPILGYGMFALISSYLFYTVFLKFYEEYLEDNSEDIILYAMPGLITGLANLSAFYQMNLSKRRWFEQFFQKFEDVDALFKSLTGNEPKAVKRTTLKFVLITLGFSSVTAYDIIFAIFHSSDLGYFRYFITDRIHIYLTFILVLLQTSLLRGIELRYAFLNETLKVTEFGSKDLKVIFKSKAETKICSLLKIHNDLGDSVEFFNKLYGYNILFNVIQISIGLLGLINLSWYYKMLFSEMLITCVWNAYITAQGIIVTSKCEHVIREGRKTISVAYKAIFRCSHDYLVREKLLVLAKQAVCRLPKFTAAGFFRVDYTTLFLLVNMITSYVIVIFQFGNKRELY